MKNFVKLFILSIILGFFFSGNVAADTYSKTISVFKQSNSVQPFFKDCYGYAVFPTAGANAGPAMGDQAKTSCHKGMAIFVHTKGGLMFEVAIGGQKFSFKRI